MRSLRSKLLLGAAMGMTLVLSASGGMLYLLVQSSLLSQFDTALAEKARSLTGLVQDEDGKTKLESEELRLPEFARQDRPEFLQIWQGDGAVLFRSPSLIGRDLADPKAVSAGQTIDAVRLLDGRPGRQVVIRFAPPQEPEKEEPKRRPGPPSPAATAPAKGREELARHEAPGAKASSVLVLARDTLDLDETLAQLRFLLVAIGAAATLVSAVVLAWVVRRGLRPIRRLAAEIEQVGEADLSIRVDLPRAPSEMLPVVQRINDMLARLQAAFTREKSFTSDVAHELRTPLAGLRSIIEVARSRVRQPDEYQDALADCLTIADQMQTMVNNLLSLARAESGQLKLTLGPVRVADVFRECWKPLAGRAEQRRLAVSWGLDPDSVLETDREQFRLVVGNLLNNAVTYADTGGNLRIESGGPAGDPGDNPSAVSSGSNHSRLELRVSNTGSQLSPEQAEHVFERFWRGDTARSAAGLHGGLGLALARKIVTVLGGTIRVESAVGGNFTVHLSFDRNGPSLA